MTASKELRSLTTSPGNLNGEVPSPFRLQSSLENVQEFRVDSSNFPAEYGTGTGGQISVVTKSGGNDFHGSAFEYLRRDAFDARNYFDNITPGIPKSELKLDQFGGSIGGPIVKDRFFFFSSYEGYRVRSGLNFVEAVPSAAARARAVASIVPYLDAFKSPDAVIIPGSTNADFDLAQLQDTAKTDENAYSLRLDYKLNTNNSMYFRFFRDNGTDDRPEGVSGRRAIISAQPQNGIFGWQSILGGNKVNEFKTRLQRRKNAHQRHRADDQRLGFIFGHHQCFGKRRQHRNCRTGNFVRYFDSGRSGSRQQRDERARSTLHAVFAFVH